MGNPYRSYRTNASSPEIVPRSAVDPCVVAGGASSSKRASGVDGRQEALLFSRRGLDDVLRAVEELGVDPSHSLDHRLHHRRQCGLLTAEQPRVPNGPAKDPAQDVPTTLVRGKYAIGKQERDRARVIGDDTKGGRIDGIRDDPPNAAREVGGNAPAHLVAFASPIRNAHDLLDRAEDGREEIRVKVAGRPLHHRRDSLEPAPVSMDGLGAA